MLIRTRYLLAASGLALMVLGTATQAHAACGAPDALVPVPMQKTAEHAETDPAGIWTKWEMWNPATPARTTIWSGSACGGEVIVSQIVNRQCSSAAECPARVVLRQGGSQRVLLDYKQVCTLHQTFQLHGDLSALEACGQSFPLDTATR
jgi:hypothetical protein